MDERKIKLTIEQSSLLLKRLPQATKIFVAATLFLSFNCWIWFFFIHVNWRKRTMFHGQINANKNTHTEWKISTFFGQIYNCVYEILFNLFIDKIVGLLFFFFHFSDRFFFIHIHTLYLHIDSIIVVLIKTIDGIFHTQFFAELLIVDPLNIGTQITKWSLCKICDPKEYNNNMTSRVSQM